MEKTGLNISYKPIFDNLVAELKVDELAMETGTASDNTKVVYDSLLEGNSMKVTEIALESIKAQIIPKMLIDYWELVVSQISKINSIAFSFSGSKLLVWAEIRENDEDMERFLIFSEAKINAQYSNLDFRLSTTIVEDVDEFPIPKQYVTPDFS